jgi:hypothetical protein
MTSLPREAFCRIGITRAAPPAKSDAEKKAETDKAAAAKAKTAEELSKAQDRVVANYKKNKGISMAPEKAGARK